MDTILQDLRFCLRNLRKSPGFATVAILTLTLGIGANTAIFSFVDGVLLKPLPYPDADRIVRVLEKPPNGDRNGISTLNFLDWKRENTVFDFMAAQTGGAVTLTGSAEPVQLRGARVSAHYFDIFRIKAAPGRTFAADEDQAGKDHVVVLSHALWQSRFGADPLLVGKTIRLDGEPYTIIGVLPAGSAFDRAYNQLWRPLVFEPENMTRNFHWFGSFALLKSGVSLKQAQAAMDIIGARIARDHPDSNKGWGVAVDSYAETIVDRDVRASLFMLLAAVGMVLLIACANIANLMLGRGASRERELAIRAALGAGRGRLIRQLLTESVVLSLWGGLLGIGLGYAAMAALRAGLPPYSFPREANVAIDIRVLVFTLLLAVVTGLVFGVAPALAATRADLAIVMKEGGRASTSGIAGRQLRNALVVVQVALAFVLLAGAGLFLRSFSRMLSVDPGFDSTNVISAYLPISDKRFAAPDRLTDYLRRMEESLRSVPGVRDVALTSALPMQGWGYGMPFQIAGRPVVDRANRADCFFKMVTPGYFQTLGMRLRRGRGLSDHDTAGSTPVTVINETMAKKYFADRDPIGQRILIQKIIPGKTQLGDEIPWEVVGVVADELVTNVDSKNPNPGVYVTIAQSPTPFQGLVIRAAMNPLLLQRSILNAVYAVDKDQPVTDMKTLEQIKSEMFASDRLRSILLDIFAALALALASIGIYGVVSYSVVLRRHEIGIRSALGANKGRTLMLIVGNGMRLTFVGLVIGVASAIALTRLFATLLFGVKALDGVTIVAVAGALISVSLAACYVPARRAAIIDPMVALRHE